MFTHTQLRKQNRCFSNFLAQIHKPSFTHSRSLFFPLTKDKVFLLLLSVSYPRVPSLSPLLGAPLPLLFFPASFIYYSPLDRFFSIRNARLFHSQKNKWWKRWKQTLPAPQPWLFLTHCSSCLCSKSSWNVCPPTVFTPEPLLPSLLLYQLLSSPPLTALNRVTDKLHVAISKVMCLPSCYLNFQELSKRGLLPHSSDAFSPQWLHTSLSRLLCFCLFLFSLLYSSSLAQSLRLECLGIQSSFSTFSAWDEIWFMC